MTAKTPKPLEINAELIYYQLTEIKRELAEFKIHYVTKEESSALKHEIQNLRNDITELKSTTEAEIERINGRDNMKNTVLWVGLVASAIINIIVIYNLFTK
jgi:predicted  nucleic acid-binding Zn-ribbon protein